MVIYTNVMALQSHRSLKTITGKQAKSSARLSSGHKINSGSDDAAGLAISEKMRAQIRGLDQASRNAQDGISLVQTAEGGLSGICSMVHRMRELSVQAANDTNQEEDREKIQEEIDQLLLEIDDTCQKTKFNKIKLLNGNLGDGGEVSETALSMLNWLNGSWLVDALSMIQIQTGLSFSNDVELTVQFGHLSSNTLATMSSSSDNKHYILDINLDCLSGIATGWGESGPVIGGIEADRLITHEIMHAVMRNNTSFIIDIPMWFTEGLAEAVSGASDTRFGDFSNAYTVAKAQSLISTFSKTTSGSDAYTAGYLAVMYIDGLTSYWQGWQYGQGGVRALLDQMVRNMESPGYDFKTAFSDTFGIDLDSVIEDMKIIAANNFDGFLDKANIGKDGGSYALDKVYAADGEAIIANGGADKPIDPDGGVITFGGYDLNITWITEAKGNPLHLQIGANANQSMYVSIREVSTKAMGLTGIDVTTHAKATEAMAKLDDALDYVSVERSRMGAYQNRLEHVIRSVEITSENLSAGESRIRDADMAKEMMALLKANILQQAATSMLSAANQQSQNVLRLLN